MGPCTVNARRPTVLVRTACTYHSSSLDYIGARRQSKPGVRNSASSDISRLNTSRLRSVVCRPWTTVDHARRVGSTQWRCDLVFLFHDDRTRFFRRRKDGFVRLAGTCERQRHVTVRTRHISHNNIQHTARQQTSCLIYLPQAQMAGGLASWLVRWFRSNKLIYVGLS